MRTTRKRAAAALALAIGIVFGAAIPAASTTESMRRIEVTGGALSTVLGNFDLTPGSTGDSGCAEKADDLWLRLSKKSGTSPNRTGTWRISGAAGPLVPGTFSGFFRLGTPPSGAWYQADFAITNGTTAGTKTETGTADVWNLAGTLNFQVRIYELYNPDIGQPVNCAKTNLKCIISGRFGITSGTYNGPNPLPASPAVGPNATINAATNAPGGLNLVTSSCQAPFVAANGTVASLAGLAVSVIP